MANKKLSATISIGGAIAPSLKSAFGNIKEQMNQVGSAIKSVEMRQRELGRVIKEQEALGKAGSALKVDLAQQELAMLDKQLAKMKQINTQITNNQRAQQKNKANRAELGGEMAKTAVVGAAIAMPAISMFNKSAQFNYDLMMIGNTAELTKEQVAKLGGELVTLSDKTGVGAESLKNAFGFLVAAGQDVTSAQANLQAIGRTAKATGSEIEDVAKASFTMGDALKVDPSQMAQAMDMLVQAGKAGNFEFKDMAAELPGLGASFQALKMNGAEAVATMGAALQIARKGAGSSSEAANNMSNFLAKIMSPDTLKKAGKMGSDLYGVISKAQQSGANPLEAAIAEINRITKGGDQKLLGEIFGDMQVQNFLRPMLQNLEEYKRIKGEVLNSKGVVDRDWETVMASSKEEVEQLTEATTGLGRAIGSSLEPIIGKLVETLTPLVRSVRDFVTEHPKLVGGVIATAAAFTTLRLAVLGTKFALTFVNGGMLKLGETLLKAKLGAALTGEALPIVSVGIRGIGLAFASTGIGALVAGLALAGLWVYRNWDGVAAFFSGMFSGITSGLEPVITAWTGLVDALGITDTLKDLWQWFTTLFEPVSYTTEELGKAGDAGQRFGKMLGDAISTLYSPITWLIEQVTWLINNFGSLDKIKSRVGGLWESTTSTVGGWFGGDKSKNSNLATPRPSLPPLATARGGGSTYQDNSQTTLQITQRPGESQEALAQRIIDTQERNRQVRQRSMMTEGMIPQ